MSDFDLVKNMYMIVKRLSRDTANTGRGNRLFLERGPRLRILDGFIRGRGRALSRGEERDYL